MIQLDYITGNEWFGRFFLTLPNAPGLPGYYNTLLEIKPFLMSKAWESSVTGFYLSAEPNADGVRISYFTEEPDLPRVAISKLLDIGILERAIPDEVPKRCSLTSEGYGGDEKSFRRFLTFYTQVAMECLLTNRKAFQQKVIETRWSTKPNGVPSSSGLRPLCEKGSAWFRGQELSAQDQFFADLDQWHNPGHMDWLHMLVQMVETRDAECVHKGQNPVIWSSAKIRKRVAELP